ncbi:hypothetical protein LJC71_07170 [Desulfosarcina sp. OttesenSCG-928-A07]|nr:hypothetical protein [Desulfosarcina sp. OttesenSCG-928-A07]
MTLESDPFPPCYGNLETVFPLGPEGLRHSPGKCLACGHKTLCLKTAMEQKSGVVLHEEMVDRSYSAGMIGFFERWARKKTLASRKK